MKKIFFLLSISLSGGFLSAQETDSLYHFKKWSYGINAAVASNFRIIKSNGSEDFLRDSRDHSEVRLIGFAGGITVNYRISDVLSINSGLTYSSIGFKTRDGELSFSDGTKVTVSTAYHFHYVSLPLDLKYDFLQKKKWNLYVSGGISPAVFIGEATSFKYGNSKSKDNQAVGYDRFNLAADLCAGIDYRLSENIKMVAGIYYKQFFNATNSNLPTKSYLNSAGLSVSFIYLRRRN